MLQIGGGVYFEPAEGRIFPSPFKAAAVAGAIQVVGAIETGDLAIMRINGGACSAETDRLLLMPVEVDDR